jgi:hypothetical protein
MTRHVHSNGCSQLRRSQAETFQVPETGIGFFAIPIMVLAATPAGTPSAPRRHAAHQFRGIARQQDPRGQGPGWVCEKSLYEDRELTHIASDAYSSRPAQIALDLVLFLLQLLLADHSVLGRAGSGHCCLPGDPRILSASNDRIDHWMRRI